MSRVVFLFFFIILLQNSFAQFDTNYVFMTRSKFVVYPLYELSYSKINYDYKTNSGITNVSYATRNYNSIGIGASFYRLGFSLSYQLPFSDIDSLENQSAFSFRGGYSYKRFYGDLRLRRYKGLEQKIIDVDGVESVKIRKDMLFSQIGVNIIYFTSSKYSFDANFKNYNQQIKSAFTFVASAGYNIYNLDGNITVPKTTMVLNSIITRVNQNSIRLLPGFAFSVVYKDFYMSIFGLFGVSFNKSRVEFNNTNSIYYNFTPDFEYIATIGYNSKDFFVSLNYSFENDYAKIKNLYVGTRNNTLSIKIGKKINSKYLGKLAKYL